MVSLFLASIACVAGLVCALDGSGQGSFVTALSRSRALSRHMHGEEVLVSRLFWSLEAEEADLNCP